MDLSSVSYAEYHHCKAVRSSQVPEQVHVACIWNTLKFNSPPEQIWSRSSYVRGIEHVNNIPTMQFFIGISKNTQSKSYLCGWEFQNNALWDTH